ncbi:SDR family NAD(P)-dependent oxidoreductase [Sphingosinicella rhizophila]|uniref:SDR family NAD(P)-dependent oxidoreductase n=1 Tax=Sphingosinicella rhizophila TaxID=3050082 RepID=A0ABU3QBI3_9SPHN|nr:SDR family NAD(P)-dependent oxidoreductase [Sphingosinicella sp. GR2756]MDT9600765.1 SDR family NAD(P)-dependent oxidoreductase [Sphingosinicella sp. GR2756]
MHRLKLLMVALAALFFTQPALAQAPAKQKAVLVTGASSGIGLAITKLLASRGFYVYATARKDEDIARLEAMDNVSGLRLDVTKQAEVDAAVKFVQAQGRGLYGVINNAGVASVAELTKTSDEDILWQHDINVLGPLRVNRAFYPMLKDSKGRTAIIGSLSAFIMGPQGGGYGMTKAAIEAYGETLALETAADGVSVAVIDPGSFKSKAREKVFRRMLTGDGDSEEPLTPEQQKIIDDVQTREAQRKEPTEVADAVLHFLTSEKPHLHYMVAQSEESANMIVRAVIDRALQLNASQTAYTLSRDELHKMLDEILAEQAVGAK